jgi:hypothetical protein
LTHQEPFEFGILISALLQYADDVRSERWRWRCFWRSGALFGHFEPFAPLWRRLLKALATLAVTAAVVLLRQDRRPDRVRDRVPAGGFQPMPSGCRVNGWTGEPREKYYALRGWPPPKR